MTASSREFLLRVEDMANELALSRQRVRDLLRDGTIPRGFRRGRRWYVLRTDWQKYLKCAAKNGGAR